MTDCLHGRGHFAGHGARPLEPGGDPRLSVCHDSGVILSRSNGIGAPCTWLVSLSLYKITVPRSDISTVHSSSAGERGRMLLLGCLCLPVRCMKGTVRAGYSTARVKQNAPRRSILCYDYVRACSKAASFCNCLCLRAVDRRRCWHGIDVGLLSDSLRGLGGSIFLP